MNATASLSGLAAAALALAGCGTLSVAGPDPGAAVEKVTGYAAGKGALIGTGIGATAGAIYDITRHERD